MAFLPKTGTMTGGLHMDIDLPHSQDWELYHNAFSLCSKKMRVCLAELGISYASHHVNLIETGAYENVSRAYLKVNPGGIVPTLVHQGHPVYESHEQIVYAAAHAGERGRALLPEEPELRGLVDHWIDCASLVGEDPTRGTEQRAGHCIPGLTVPIFATMVRYIPYRKIAFGLLFHPHKERPLIFATLKARGIENLPKLSPAMKLLSRSREHMKRHLDALGQHLERSGGPWLAGERFTLADVSWVVILDRLVEVDWDGLFWGEGRRPAVAAYWERLQKRPSFAEAITAHRPRILLDGIEDVKRAKRENAALREALEGAPR